MIPWRVLQLADSAFPTGGFAHSSGLEAAAQLGEVTPATLAGFLRQSLWQLAFTQLPFMRDAHRTPVDLARYDALIDVFLTSHVARRASVTQGRALVGTLARVFRGPPLECLESMDAAVRARRLLGHHAPLYGAALSALEVSTDDSAQLFVHQGIRGVVSAAVRLGLTGPHEAQRYLDEIAPVEVEVLDASREIRSADVAQTAPLLDLFGATHDRLYARLFQS